MRWARPTSLLAALAALCTTTTLCATTLCATTLCATTLCATTLCATRASAQPADWSGPWDSQWRDGRARIVLSQDGDQVTGYYVPRNGHIEGTLDESGRILSGRFREDGRRGRVTFNLAPDGHSFMGRFDSGEWWNGGRLSASENLASWTADLGSPRDALRSFLVAFNEVRYGGMEFVEPGLSTIDFRDEGRQLTATEKFERASLLFEVVDLCVLALWDLPDSHHLGGRLAFTYRLDQLGTPHFHDQAFRPSPDGSWRLVAGSQQSLLELRARLREARSISTPDPEAHFELRTPRATVRTFIEQIKRWDEGGREHVLGTMDLSELEPGIRETEAPLLAEYLQQVLDRAGFLVWQELPNDPASQRPYVHFEHPLGTVEVAPFTDTEGGKRWRFTAATLRTVRTLYDAFEDLPVAEGLTEVEKRSTYFRLRSGFRAQSGWFVQRAGVVERWQVLCLALLVIGAFGYGVLIYRAPLWVVRRRRDEALGRWRRLARRFIAPFALLTAGLGLHELFAVLGIPPTVLWLIGSASWVVAALGGTALVYNSVHTLGERMFRRAERGDSTLDEILVSLVVSTLKLLTVVTGMFVIADVLTIPYRTVFAGLGIGGLAFAIAAQDTLANFFGSAVLLADRPFRRGDLIQVGDHMGHVEHLGLRSTRIRTFDDSIVVIPNRELAREAIDNRSRRRTRRVVFQVGASYGTEASAVEALIQALGDHYRDMPEVSTEDVLIGVEALGASSIDISVSLYLDVEDYDQEVRVRHRVLMDAIQLAEDRGVDIAFPTRTVHLHRDAAQP